jgi:hypothetical protein
MVCQNEINKLKRCLHYNEGSKISKDGLKDDRSSLSPFAHFRPDLKTLMFDKGK